MRNMRSIHIVLQLILIATTSRCFSAEQPPSEQSSKYLEAVQEFADNVLKYGRDTYGPKHTPLFVDGLNIYTHEPVKWISPKSEEPTPDPLLVFKATGTEGWILSNFASQQTLLRTLDGVSAMTGDPKYRNAAIQAIKYAFENLTDRNGLFYWGDVVAYDALRDRVKGSATHSHALKVNYPYYELMWQVNPEGTKRYIEAYWSAHIIDWSNLDFNRGTGDRDKLVLEEPWHHEYKGRPTFFKSKESWAHGFFHSGTSLAHAATTLSLLSGQEQPLVWGKRLIKRFIDARHPNTGISPHKYNQPQRVFVGGGMEKHFIDPYVGVFPFYPCVHPSTGGRDLYYFEDVKPHQWLSILLLGDIAGERGKEFTQWALEELTAWGKASYRPRDNMLMPILTDGTSIEGVVLEKTAVGAPKGSTAKPMFVGTGYLWLYATASRTTNDAFMWQMTRDIAKGNGFGDIGETPEQMPALDKDTGNSDAYSLLAFLELYEKTRRQEFLSIARRIADNMLESRFHEGFFVPSRKHVYTKFDCFEPLALLRLVAAIEKQAGSVPQVWPNSPVLSLPYRYKQQATDRHIIYPLTEISDPPLSLQEAAATGNVDLVRTLIESGTHVDSVDDCYFKTALQRVAIAGHKDIAALLIDHGASVDYKDGQFGSTSLHYAVQYGHRDIVELLIEQGADINAKNDQGKAPIDIAMGQGRMDIASVLIDNGAEASFLTKMRVSMARQERRPVDLSLFTAAKNGEQQEVKALLDQGADINAKDDQGMTALHLAAQGGHTDVVEFLLSKDADINAQNIKGYTPLYSAIWKNDPNMVGLLVSKGADVNFSPEDDYSPLHHAVWEENLDIIKVLIDNGADCDVKDQDGWTDFRYAADEANREIIELFVANGADVSGIYRAACLGNVARVEALLEQGAAVDEKDELGWTPLYWACSMGQEAVGEFLLSKGAQVSARTDSEGTPLQAACYSGAFRLVELLVSKGADVNAKDKFGRTPLQSAAMQGSRQIAELLIAKGADVNAKNRNNWTPLHLAAIGGHKDVAELLISHGVDTTVKDNRGRTALDLAEQRRHTEIVELLRSQVFVHDVSINRVSAPDSCVQGKTVSIRVTVENPGNYEESAALRVTSIPDDTEIGSKTVELLAGGEADLIFDSPATGLQHFGNYVYHGDVNGDGYDDLLITASRFNECQGRAYLYYGGTRMDTSPDLVFTGEAIGDYLSEGAWLTDLNCDGYSDVILGAFGHNNKQGRVYVYYGGENPDAKVDVTINGEPGTVGKFGRTCTAGDVNGDGYEDLFVGAQQYDGDYTGRVYLYYGGDPMDTTCDLIMTGENPDDTFGWMIDSSGDVDGDGFCDLVVATRWWPKTTLSGGDAIGRAYLYYGGNPMDGVCDIVFTGENKNDQFGSGLEVADTDGDGRADIFIGARGYANYSGRVYLYWGKERRNLTNRADLLFEAESGLSAFGGDDIEVGDIDGDGYGDITIAAYGYPRNAGSGRVYLYYGINQANANTACDRTITFSGRDNLAQFMSIGDFDSDGYGDLVVGGWGYPDGARQGQVWLCYGGPSKCTGITFNWDTTNASIGKHTLKVEIAPVPGEQNTEDNVKTVTVEVKEPGG